MQGNQLSGPLPEMGGDTQPNLFYLNFASNQFTGPIPTALAQLPGLTYVSFGNNQLTGSIPPEFGQLSNLISNT